MSSSLPISLLRQHCFCPRIPYFQELLGIMPSYPIWVKQGEDYHRQQPNLAKHRSLKRYDLEGAEQVFNIPVSSEKMGLHGILDSLLITNTHIYPVEFKLSGHRPTRGQLIQCIAYGIVAEDQFQKTCTKGFMLFGKNSKINIVEINDETRAKVFETRDAIKQNLDKSYRPDSSASYAQCGQCEYLNHCNDRE